MRKGGGRKVRKKIKRVIQHYSEIGRRIRSYMGIGVSRQLGGKDIAYSAKGAVGKKRWRAKEAIKETVLQKA